MNQMIRFENSSITDVESQNPTSTVVEVGFGSLIIRNLSLYNITSSIFSIKGVSVDIDSMYVDSIFCLESSSFCIVEGKQSNFTFSNLTVTNVTSSTDLFDLSVSTDYIKIFNSTFSYITPLTNFEQVLLFDITCPDVIVKDCIFNNLHGSSLSLQNSHFVLTNNIFYNEPQETFARLPSQFLLFSSSYGTIKNNSFTMNSLGYSQNGGVSYLILTITLIFLGYWSPWKWW